MLSLCHTMKPFCSLYDLGGTHSSLWCQLPKVTRNRFFLSNTLAVLLKWKEQQEKLQKAAKFSVQCHGSSHLWGKWFWNKVAANLWNSNSLLRHRWDLQLFITESSLVRKLCAHIRSVQIGLRSYSLVPGVVFSNCNHQHYVSFISEQTILLPNHHVDAWESS